MSYIFNLLTDGDSEATTSSSSDWGTWIFLIILVIAFVAVMVWQNHKSKKQREEQESTLKSIRPGNKVKTIGGICGIVVEVNPEENTFVLETGSEVSGKSFMKFDMAAIYQTDAKAESKPETEGTEKKGFFSGLFKKKEKPAESDTTPAVEENREDKNDQ